MKGLPLRTIDELPTLEDVASAIARDYNTDPDSSHSRNSNRFANRFGEVLAAWASCRSLTQVAEQTGLTTYVIRKYFLTDQKFRDTLAQANAAIFKEATQSIRDNQASMVEQAQRLAQDALNEMERLLNESESEGIRFKVAQDLLDRDPRISRTKRIEATGVNITIEQKTISLAIEAAGELEARNFGSQIAGPKAPNTSSGLTSNQLQQGDIIDIVGLVAQPKVANENSDTSLQTSAEKAEAKVVDAVRVEDAVRPQDANPDAGVSGAPQEQKSLVVLAALQEID